MVPMYLHTYLWWAFVPAAADDDDDDDDDESEGREEEMIDDFFFDDEGISLSLSVQRQAPKQDKSVSTNLVLEEDFSSWLSIYVMILWHESAGYESSINRQSSDRSSDWLPAKHVRWTRILEYPAKISVSNIQNYVGDNIPLIPLDREFRDLRDAPQIFHTYFPSGKEEYSTTIKKRDVLRERLVHHSSWQ